MKGYGQPMITPEQYAQALTSFDSMQRQQQTRDTINASGNGYSQVGAGIGSALASMFGKNKGKNMGELEQQILRFQEQKATETEQRNQQKLAQEQQIKQKKQMESLIPQFGDKGAAAIVFGGAKPSDVKQDRTNQMQNLEAMGLQQGTPQYTQAMRQQMGKSGNTVNVNTGDAMKYGSVPDGYAMRTNEQGAPELLPIPNHPVFKEQEAAKSKAMLKGAIAFNDAENINEVINRSLENTNSWTTGLLGTASGAIPGTQAFDLRENMKTIEADAAFSTLQNMRDSSPTGGALGQVSERELALLSSAKAALSASQSTDQFKENLKRYQQVRNQAMAATAKAYEMDYNEPAPWLAKKENEPQAPKSIGGKQYVQIDGQWYEQ